MTDRREPSKGDYVERPALGYVQIKGTTDTHVTVGGESPAYGPSTYEREFFHRIYEWTDEPTRRARWRIRPTTKTPL